MKRVDFDPKGDRHPETRGKSGYERISWDEALDIVAGEMKRIRSTYGPEAITAIDIFTSQLGTGGLQIGAVHQVFQYARIYRDL